jgi:hypothetical protein
LSPSYFILEKIFETGSAVPGSGAGFSIGLVMAGSMNPTAIEAVLNYCTENTHQKSEKVIRGGVIALALICFAQEEKADDLINRMKADRVNYIYASFCCCCCFSIKKNNSSHFLNENIVCMCQCVKNKCLLIF